MTRVLPDPKPIISALTEAYIRRRFPDAWNASVVDDVSDFVQCQIESLPFYVRPVVYFSTFWIEIYSLVTEGLLFRSVPVDRRWRLFVKASSLLNFWRESVLSDFYEKMILFGFFSTVE